MNPPLIQVKGLSVSYDRKMALKNVYLDLAPGKMYGVIGPNGAGKSTLFKAMLGLIEANTGEVRINGQAVKHYRKRMVYVPQKSDIDWQFPATVLDVVMMGRYPHKRLWQRLNAEDRALALQALKDMGIDQLRDRQIGALSGGQQQRVFLARALCQEADLFFLDEPFVGIDVTTEEKIIQILKQLTSQGKTILVIHHDLSSVRDYFDEVIMVNQRLIAAGPVSDTFTDAHVAQAFGGQLTILHKTAEL